MAIINVLKCSNTPFLFRPWDRVWEDVIFYFVYYEVFLKVISGIVLDTKSKFCMQSKMTIFNVSE